MRPASELRGSAGVGFQHAAESLFDVNVAFWIWWSLQWNDQFVVQALVRTLAVIVRQVLLGRVVKHLLAKENHAACKFTFVAAHEPFHVSVQIG